MPKSISADIERINVIRNGFSHAFFPENLKKIFADLQGQECIFFRRREASKTGLRRNLLILSKERVTLQLGTTSSWRFTGEA